jgi:hypothetical protein
MPTNNTPAGDSLISNLPTAGALLGTEQFPLDSVLSGVLTTTKISSATLANQILNIAGNPININNATITNSTFSNGTINSSTIGLTTPAAAQFTTLTLVTPLAVSSGGTGLATLTANSVLLGEGTSNVAFASPGTSGQMLLSTGASSNPAFGNNPVITGGTIDSTPIGSTTPSTGSFTTLNATSGINSTNIGATTPGTGAFTTLSASSTVSGTGFSTYLASPPAIGGTAPAAGSFTTLSATSTLTGFPGRLLNVQVFTSSGTYTPTNGTNAIIVEVQGAGGAGGGTPSTNASQFSSTTGGGAGGYARVRYTSGITTQTVTIGAGGVGSAGAMGGTGGTTSFGSLISSPGGVGGPVGVAGTSDTNVGGGAGGAVATISGGTDLFAQKGANAPTFQVIALTATSGNIAGVGANSFLSQGGTSPGTNSNGVAAYGFGSGGSGSAASSSQGTFAGGPGGGAIITVYEYS